ncbi:hypothetical protein BDZ97DRAFT_2056381 [Flammula alnicola]|nr:hypothetical protein BDZ97DRAFT_2056381 [Flammula alnicola]
MAFLTSAKQRIWISETRVLPKFGLTGINLKTGSRTRRPSHSSSLSRINSTTASYHTTPSSSSSTTGKTQVKLAILFNYTLDSTVREGLGFYWTDNVKNLEEDLLAHERAAAEATTPASAPSTSCSESSRLRTYHIFIVFTARKHCKKLNERRTRCSAVLDMISETEVVSMASEKGAGSAIQASQPEKKIIVAEAFDNQYLVYGTATE